MNGSEGGQCGTVFTTSRIKNKYGDNICRRCINRQYMVNLTPRDCRYGYQYVCPRCKKTTISWCALPGPVC